MDEYPIAMDPPHVDRRLAVQRSHFTLHGTGRASLLNLRNKRLPKRSEWLEKIPIDPDPEGAGVRRSSRRPVMRNPETTKKIREELAVCGVVDTAVFPDLSALGSQLERDWREKEKT